MLALLGQCTTPPVLARQTCIIRLLSRAGTVHLRFPRLAAVCRALGADFAHAMAGFEIKGGRSVPAIEGVVVCAEDEGRVMAAYHTAEQCVSGF